MVGNSYGDTFVQVMTWQLLKGFRRGNFYHVYREVLHKKDYSRMETLCTKFCADISVSSYHTIMQLHTKAYLDEILIMP